MRLSIVLLLLAGCPDNSNKPSCPSSFTVCSGTCTATSVDPANCGTCGHACAAGQQCQGGSCSSSCPSGSTACGDSCVQTASDNANCGTCGNACPAGKRCSAGTCAASCSAGFTDCVSYCADTANDSQNCGACGTVCPSGQRCASGSCSASCATGRTACNGGCVDVQTDPANCGGCGTVCPTGEVCQAGACSCGITTISTGWLTECGQRSDGKVVCSGALNYGCWDSQTAEGVGTACNPSFPVGSLAGWVVPGLDGAARIDSGREFMCALKTDGTVWCLGSNEDGRLGNNEAVPSPKPSPVQVLASPAPAALSGVKQLALGAAHACALKTNGELWCWGKGGDGRLGTGNTASSPIAVPVTLPGAIGAIKKVVGGEAHTCVIAADNSVWCWGKNDFFQCGLNQNTSPQLTPQQVVGLDSVSDLVSRFDTTCAIRSDKTLWCWGQNRNSQAGLQAPPQTVSQVPSPTPQPLTDVAEVSTGISHTCARQSTGKVFCWGHNGQGEIGNGTRDPDTHGFNSGSSNPSPAPVIGTDNQPIVAKALSVNHGHSCAIVGASNHPYCWGNNKKGQSGLTVPFSTVARPVVSCGY